MSIPRDKEYDFDKDGEHQKYKGRFTMEWLLSVEEVAQAGFVLDRKGNKPTVEFLIWLCEEGYLPSYNHVDASTGEFSYYLSHDDLLRLAKGMYEDIQIDSPMAKQFVEKFYGRTEDNQ